MTARSLFAPDDWVELALAGRLGEIAAELVEDERARRRPSAGPDGGRRPPGLLARLALVAGEQLDDLLADLVEVGAEATSTCAATPSPSRMRPRRMCSVPIWLCPS